jgi:hypothetical protein
MGRLVRTLAIAIAREEFPLCATDVSIESLFAQSRSLDTTAVAITSPK